jgi:serine/threonine protein kinase
MDNYYGYKIKIKDYFKNIGVFSNAQFLVGEKNKVQYLIKKSIDPVKEIDKEAFELALKRRKTISDYLNEQKIDRQLNIIYEKEVFTDEITKGLTYIISSQKLVKNIVEKDEVFNLPISDKMEIIKELTELVFAIHKVGVVHGDIKLSNFLFSKNKDKIKPNLIDFDQCFFEVDYPYRSQIVYSMYYFAPEVHMYREGSINCVNSAIDVYSLGVVFYEILSGGFFPENTTFALKQISNPDFKLIKSRKIKTEVHNLIEKMLSFDPNERPNISSVLKYLKTLDASILEDESKLWLEHASLFEPISEEIIIKQSKKEDFLYEVSGFGDNLKLKDLIEANLVVERKTSRYFFDDERYEITSSFLIANSGILKIDKDPKYKNILNLYTYRKKLSNNVESLIIKKIIRRKIK